MVNGSRLLKHSHSWETLLDDLDTDSDDESEEDGLFFLIFVASIVRRMKQKKPFHVRPRVDWDHHVAQLLAEPNGFYKLYRVSYL